MKIITFRHNNQESLGLVHQDYLIAISNIGDNLPDNMEALLNAGQEGLDNLYQAFQTYLENSQQTANLSFEEVEILAPVPRPTSLRDAYAFHAQTAD